MCDAGWLFMTEFVVMFTSTYLATAWPGRQWRVGKSCKQCPSSCVFIWISWKATAVWFPKSSMMKLGPGRFLLMNSLVFCLGEGIHWVPGAHNSKLAIWGSRWKEHPSPPSWSQEPSSVLWLFPQQGRTYKWLVSFSGNKLGEKTHPRRVYPAGFSTGRSWTFDSQNSALLLGFGVHQSSESLSSEGRNIHHWVSKIAGGIIASKYQQASFIMLKYSEPLISSFPRSPVPEKISQGGNRVTKSILACSVHSGIWCTVSHSATSWMFERPWATNSCLEQMS